MKKPQTVPAVYRVLAPTFLWCAKNYHEGELIKYTPHADKARREQERRKLHHHLREKSIRIANSEDLALETLDGKGTAKKIPQTVSAELPSGEPAPLTKVGRFQIVDHAAILPSPFQPRKDFTSPEAVAEMKELAASIREQGIIEPLIVRPRPGSKSADEFELVAGERRWRGADIAGLAGVPCIVRRLNDVEVIEIQTIENLQRRNINPIEEANGYELLMRKGNYKMADLVKKTGKSEASIYARLKLLDAPPGIRKAIEENRLSASTGELVARQEVEHRGAFMDAVLHPEGDIKGEEPGGVLSFRQAKQWLDAYKQRVARETEWQAKVKTIPLAKTAAKVLTAEESIKVVSYGYVRDPNKYVLPGTICPGDPKQRTYAEVAEAAGRALPAPVLARDLADGKAMALLPRGETEKALAGLVPTAAELEGLRKAETERRQAETERRQAEIKTADAKREESNRRKAERVQEVLLACIEHPWSATMDELFLRFAVGAAMARCHENDAEEMIDALREFGVPLEKDADHDSLDEVWFEQYLAGCDVPTLRGWLLYFSLRDPLSYGDYAVDEVDLALAEELFGTEAQPQTSAVRGEELI